jgi:tRNA(Ile2)-agmatinylcytidine synthase
VIPGGHVIFTIRDETGELHCAAYEPTRFFRKMVKELVPGDEVIVHGSVKEKPGLPPTLNLEKLEVVSPVEIKVKVNPSCPSCRKRMKSLGRNKGYRCPKCGKKLPESAAEYRPVQREITTGKFEVPPRARRHLSKPLVRELAQRQSFK